MPESTPVDLDKLRSIGVLGRRTKDRVREYRRNDGVRVKETTDQLGNTTTEHANGRVDVNIRAPEVAVRAATTEIRS